MSGKTLIFYLPFIFQSKVEFENFWAQFEETDNAHPSEQEETFIVSFGIDQCDKSKKEYSPAANSDEVIASFSFFFPFRISKPSKSMS